MEFGGLMDYLKISIHSEAFKVHGVQRGTTPNVALIGEGRIIEKEEDPSWELIHRRSQAVYTGVDLEHAIDVCLGSSFKDGNISNAIKHSSASGLSLKLLGKLNFVKENFGDTNISPLMELLESRIELRHVLLTSHRRLKDLLFLDISLDSAVRTTEKGLKNVNFANPPEVLFLFSLMIENLRLSTVNNEDYIYCTKLVLAERSQYYHKRIQPSAQYLGNLLGVPKWTIDIFTEELIRSGCSAIMSILINHFDPILRKVANLGCWQGISAVEVSGFVTFVNELITAQYKVYRRATIIIASKRTDEEEIPEGVVAVLTADTPDVLSHISTRARNSLLPRFYYLRF